MHGCQDSKENEASRQELGNRNPEQASKIDKQSSSRAPPLGCPEPLQSTTRPLFAASKAAIASLQYPATTPSSRTVQLPLWQRRLQRPPKDNTGQWHGQGFDWTQRRTCVYNQGASHARNRLHFEHQHSQAALSDKQGQLHCTFPPQIKKHYRP
eukprot:scaffold90581_cov20-Tisochrysis_lutea.AAC.2